jgi:benzoyl-CoA reductase/2-hydroxyglutaryl-CoA dehydratase subunit BcrC/BadD/HgdB
MISRRLQYDLAGRVVGPMLMTLESWRAARKRRGRKPKQNPFGPPLESAGKLKELMGSFYFQGRYADGAVPVAWVTSGFPVEVLRAYGFYTVYPENHAALCSARRMTPQLAGVAEEAGYSRDLCAYARIDIGSVLAEVSPVGRVPRPDLICACSNICQTVIYWFRALADHFGVPFFLIDTPFVYGDFQPHHIDFVKDQLDELTGVAETVAGHPCSEVEIRSVVEQAWQASRLWGECLDMGRSHPAPWTAFDHFIHLAPIVALRGSQECTAYYRGLRDELADRVKHGIGGIKEERHRLLWDNIAIWYRLKDLSWLFAEHGFAFVAATYSSAWWDSWKYYDPDNRLDSTARIISGVLLNRDLPNRLQIMKRLISEHDVDGAVLHSDRSCKPYSVGQYDLKDALSRELGIRVAVLEADHADPRSYSAEQVETRLQAFMESF